MPADTLSSVEDEVESRSAKARKAAKAAVANAADTGQEKLNEAIEIADRTLRDAARRIEKAVREGVETVRSQSGPYRDNAVQQFDEAQQYVVERIKERPVVATLAGLGVGLLVGLLMASRSEK
ncbi:MAG TPA: hypothetical protein VFE13_12740 [Caulobacteraceae bacterium]|jgi:ElaB/YqjD/DUF883 family membrane-anchored ribosome-binding protein|nr:hypothetical protein [Caulobacteraceae bacterium]